MMDVLGRESAPINAALWKQIDETVIETARKLLIGRRFLSLAESAARERVRRA